jgi:short-subunit dehydrogenase
MTYELEQLGIKVVLIEPDVIRTNFEKVIARKSNDANSPYSDMMKMMSSRIGKLLENGSNPDLVAKVIVEAATCSNPKLRYLAGRDVEQWIAARNTMSDEQFRTMMMQGAQ